MDVHLIFLLSVLFLNAEITSSDNLIRNKDETPPYILATPSTLTSGTTNRLCVSRFDSATHGAAVVNVDVVPVAGKPQERLNALDFLKYAARTQKTLPRENGGCFDLYIPALNESRVQLIFRMRFELSSVPEIKSMRTLSVVQNSAVTVIQTDKPIYRPNDLMRFRILLLKNDLTPYQGNLITIYLEAPSFSSVGFVGVMQWHSVIAQNGIVQKEYALDQYAVMGTWRIQVKLNGMILASRSFQVSDYSLPSYDVIIDFPKRISVDARRVTWIVCVRQPWGSVVRGLVMARLRRIPEVRKKMLSPRISPIDQTRRCADFTYSSLDIGLKGASTFVASFDFQETGSRSWRNTSVISSVVQSGPKLDIVEVEKLIAGLPYTILVKANAWNNSPLRNTSITLCHHFADNVTNKSSAFSNCVTAKSNNNGVVQHSVVIPRLDKNEFMEIKVSLSDVKYRKQKDEIRKTFKIMKQMKTAIKIEYAPRSETQNIDKIMDLNIFFNFGNTSTVPAVTLHYMIVTRGGTIHRWGSVTQCPYYFNETRTKPLNAYRDSICYQNSNQDTVYKLTLSFRFSIKMCPTANIIVYFYKDGEISADNIDIQYNECFISKVNHRWSPRTVTPGSSAKLLAETQGPSVCGTVVRQAGLAKLTTINTVQSDVIEGLKEYSEVRRNFSDKFGRDVCGTDLPEQKSTWLAFRSSGIELITNRMSDLDLCSHTPQKISQSSNDERKYFPETFLWALTTTESNGSFAAITNVPDTITKYESEVFCVSKYGLSIGRKAVLTVFKEVFVDFVCPKVVKRYEQFEAHLKILNYSNKTLALLVNLSTVQDLEIFVSSGSPFKTKTVCINSYETYTEYLTVSASNLGEHEIIVESSVNAQVQPHCGGKDYDEEMRDHLKLAISVVPEGVVQQIYKSGLLCPQEGNNEIVWNWKENNLIENSNKWIVAISGDVTGLLNMNTNKMLPFPMGCGEQNMALLSYNLITLEHLQSSMDSYTSISSQTQKAVNNIVNGFQKQVTRYRHPGGGFSAFGATDEEPSTWLTAFCLKYLPRLKQLLNWDVDLRKDIEWLLSLQLENGCFENKGQVFHDEYMGGISSAISLSAFTVIALIASGADINPKVLENAEFCLNAHPSFGGNRLKAEQLFSFILATYAQMEISEYKTKYYQNLIPSVKANLEHAKHSRSLDLIKNAAMREGNFIWWDTGSLSESIEASSYVILILVKCFQSTDPITMEQCGIIEKSSLFALISGAIKWISTHRNSEGGFVSTQDTLLATEALTSYSKLLPSTISYLTLTLKIGSQNQTFQIGRDSLSRQFEWTEYGNLTLTAVGRGCVTVQMSQQFNVFPRLAEVSSPFELNTKVKTDGPFDCKHGKAACKCAARLEVCVTWLSSLNAFPKMAILEIVMPTDYFTDLQLQYSLIKHNNSLLRRIEESDAGSKLYFYLTSNPTSRNSLHECFQLYLVGPQLGSPTGSAKVYDYYKPQIFTFTNYFIPDKCQINKARSHNDFDAATNLYTINLITDSELNLGDDEVKNDTSVQDTIITIEPDLNSQEAYVQNGTHSNISDVVINEKGSSYYEKLDFDKPSGFDPIKINPENKEQGFIIEFESNTTAYKNNSSIHEFEQLKDSTTEYEDECEMLEHTTETLNENEFHLNEIQVEDSTHIRRTDMVVNETYTEEKIWIHFNESKNIELKTTTRRTNVSKDDNITNYFPNFHIIDSSTDLATPSGIEGYYTEYVLPPKGFNESYSIEEIISVNQNPQHYSLPDEQFVNWTITDTDLSFPDGIEGNYQEVVKPDNKTIFL